MYIDSVAGNDGNVGTSNFPIATLAMSATVNRVGQTNYLKRGSLFREQYPVPTNSSTISYGTGNKPIISGASLLTNSLFTLTAGQTFTYEYLITPALATNIYASGWIYQSNVMMVIDNNNRLGTRWDANAGFGSIANVEANAGSFWWNPANHKLYVHKSNGGSPITDGDAWQASVRTLCMSGGDGAYVQGIQGEWAYAFDSGGSEGYQYLNYGFGASTIKSCLFRGGWNHIAGVANGITTAGQLTFDSCTIGDADPLSGGTICIAYRSGAGSAPWPIVLFTNCLIYSSAGNVGSTWGVYAHGGAVDCRVVGCEITNCYQAFELGGGDGVTAKSGLWDVTDSTFVNCGTVFEAQNSGTVLSNLVTYGCGSLAYFAAGDTNNMAVINSKFIGEQNGYYVEFDHTPTNYPVFLISNSIFAETNFAGSAIQFNSGGKVLFITNSVYGLDSAFLFAGTTIPSTNFFSCDYNNYYTNTAFARNAPGTVNALVNWQNSYPTLDAHSTTNNPGYSSSFFSPPNIIDPSLP
jgi:hypothetical protein